MRHLDLALALTLLAAAPAFAQPANCDAIRAGIDAKIRAAGASGYTLTVVDAGAKVAGKVVGSCDLGTKKIVYASGTDAPAAPASVPPPSRSPPILTECKDGSVSVGGDCKR